MRAKTREGLQERSHIERLVATLGYDARVTRASPSV
jgi:hypothetical protein